MLTLLTVIVYVLVFAMGASAGSFLSVVVHRIPKGRSILLPPSHCPVCQHRLKLWENVPVFGWFWLKGRCSVCKTRIPFRYPLLEIACGIAFLGIFWIFGLSWQTVGYCLFFCWLLALSLIDLETMELPHPLTQSGLVAGLVYQGVLGLVTTQTIAGSLTQLMEGIIGAVVGIWVVDVIIFAGSAWLGRQAMGGGDGHLSAMMGAWLGWKLFLLAGFLACAVGAAVSGLALALNKMERREPFPFGPFLAIGAMITAIWGNAIIALYLHVFFPTL